MSDSDVVEAMARGICQERCAFLGEPACWQLDADDGGPYPWPPEDCDSPGCMALAQAALAAVRAAAVEVEPMVQESKT